MSMLDRPRCPGRGSRVLLILVLMFVLNAGGGSQTASEADIGSTPVVVAPTVERLQVEIATSSPTPAATAVVAAPAPTTEASTSAAPTTASSTTASSTTAASTTVPTPSLVEPTATPEPDCDGPSDDLRFGLEVVDVAPDDVDGGLVVHDSAGASTPTVGVLPWDAGNLQYVYSSCTIVDDGGEWWEVTGGDLTGWVNARYLGDRTVDADSFDATPCSADTEEPPATETSPASNASVTIADIDVSSSQACDRVVITLTEDWTSFGSVTTTMGTFPPELLHDVRRSAAELELVLASEVEPFWVLPHRTSWSDVATNETNVALAFERDETTSVYVGWGTGQAAVRYLDDPARAVIDIFQTPTDEGSLAGPIVGPAILFEPIQADLFGPGVTLPITVRGYSWGFESSSTFSIAPWDQTAASHPFEWDGEIFGLAANQTFADGVTLEPQLSQWANGPVFPFMTRGYFEFQITGLPVGAYQLAVAPSTGCSGPLATGQQFRVIDDDSTAQAATGDGFAQAMPFSLSFAQFYDEAFTSTTVLGEEQTIAVEDQC